MWNSNLFYEKLLDGWERSETSNGLPYYINHNLECTQWDHPLLTKMFEELVGMNSIRYAAYRTAMKLRFVQKRLGFEQVSLHSVQTVLERRGLAGSVDTAVDCVELYGILIDVVQVARSSALNLTTEQQAELALNLLLNLYDVNRTGCIRLVSIKVGLAVICSGRLSEKYRYFFQQMADSTGHLTRKRLGCLLQDLIQIPEVMNESQPFGGLNVTAAVESCFSMVWGTVGVTEDVFLSWLLREPQTLVWLPTMHQVAAAESVKHESKCNTCKAYPIVGFRYKCLKCFNYDMCQECFFTGRLSKNHKLKHPTQEYCIATTSKEDAKAFLKTVRNNLSKKHRSKHKLRYLPIQGFEAGRGVYRDQEDQPPPDVDVNTDIAANQLPAKVTYGDVTDYPYEQKAKTKLEDKYIGESQRRELENVINQLENENRELMYEIERLHQRRSESGSERGSEDGGGRRSPVTRNNPATRHSPIFRHDPDARQDVLKAHNQQLEIQLQRLRDILNDVDMAPSGLPRAPLRTLSSNLSPGWARSQSLTAAIKTPPRVLKQPPPYSPSPAASPRRTTSFRRPPARMPGPLSYDDHVGWDVKDFPPPDAGLDMTGDGALSRTHFELPSAGESQYFPIEEAELAELIERLDQAYPADVSQSVLDRDSTTVLEMGRAANQMGEAFGQHPLDCEESCVLREEDDFSDAGETVISSVSTRLISQPVSLLS